MDGFYKKNLKFHCNVYSQMSSRFLFCGRDRNEKCNANMVCLAATTYAVYIHFHGLRTHTVAQVIAIIRARRMVEILVRSQMTFGSNISRNNVCFFVAVLSRVIIVCSMFIHLTNIYYI